jgi:hypothetical protein
MVVDDHVSRAGSTPAWVGHPRVGSVGDPPFGRAACNDRTPGSASASRAAAQLVAQRAGRDAHPMPSPEDLGDLGRRAAGKLEAKRHGLLEQLGGGPHQPGVRTRLGAQGGQASGPVLADPTVDR